MNAEFQRVKIEDTLFFDIETVRRNKVLEVDSTEYTMFQWKNRDKANKDKFLGDKELQDLYERVGGLEMGYNRIVTIGVGVVIEGTPYIRALEGTEEEIIEKFCEIAQGFKYISGANILRFDLPIVNNNGWKYFNMTEKLPERFITSEKAPWNLKEVKDLMDMFKGTYYKNNSVEEICHHFGIPTPKDDIKGSEVSEVFYSEGVERILTYVKKDVLANINIFLKMQGKEIFTDFVDRTNIEIKKPNLLQRLYNDETISLYFEEELLSRMKDKKPTKKDWDNIEKMIYGTLVREDFINFDQDNKKTLGEKEVATENLIERLKENLK